MAKLPAFQFYPGDWMKDPALRSVSLQAKGLWIDLICLMHECERRGYLMMNGQPYTLEQIARATGCSTDECSSALSELENCGVIARSADGILHSRRMIRDEKIRQERAKAGKKGGCKSRKTQGLKHDKQNVSKTKANSKQIPEDEDEDEVEDEVEENKRKIRPADIEKIYAAYPRKVGAAKAREKIGKALGIIADRGEADPVAWLLDRVREFAASPAGMAGDFVPYPATWFHQGRYDDDPAEWRVKGDGRRQQLDLEGIG